ncbi:MAG: hypothetical protein CMP65_03535 [Flavobacteriales bacterium]|nr:hypothetical protein [Flavobacteriales bacterium]
MECVSQNYGHLGGNYQINHQIFEEYGETNEQRAAYTSSYLNLIYNYKNLTIGNRMELYRNPIDGFLEYEGYGIANSFIQYKNKLADITIGNFYEEFGSGLILKTYYDPNLGIDNSIGGVKIKSSPFKGVYITTLIGKQRSHWKEKSVDESTFSWSSNEYSNGLIKALNTDISINEIMLKKWNTKINTGFSFVTKKEEDSHPRYILPENVGAFNGRLNISKKNVSISVDYAGKINDPSSDNNYIYQNGNALILTSNYSQKGFGVSFGLKRIQNMSFRSERNASFQDLHINYITPFTKQQAYALATIYPYPSQPNGEMGSQIDIFYTIPKKTKLGGKYGTSLNINFANVFNIDQTLPKGIEQLNERATIGYNSNFLKLGPDKLFQELNIEIIKKVNKNFKLIGTYINLQNNDKLLTSQDIMPGGTYEYIEANIFILESILKNSKYLTLPLIGKTKPVIRSEIQHLSTKQHFGNWAMGLIELKLSKLFLSVQDLYNYGNDEKPHYYSMSAGYNKGASRLAVTYGKQRKGLFCVGGVCREVPASSGLTISLTTSF